MPRVVFAVTVAMTAQAFLRDQATALAARGWQVDIVCSPDDGTDSFVRLQDLVGVTIHPLAMERALAPLSDLRAYRALLRILRDLDPDVVIASTPKASLLALLAARRVGTPTRIFHVRGLRSEGLGGALGALTRLAERTAIRASTDVLVDSPSLLDTMRRVGLLAPGQGRVLGDGSCCGVDVVWFRPPTRDERERARADLGVDSEAIVVGFLGRLARDKGIGELVAASTGAHGHDSRIRLILVGPLEEPRSAQRALAEVENASWAHRVEHTADPRAAYWAFDMLVLPSYREGFPISPLEAQACGLPVITTDATGCIDAIHDGVTGILVPARDTESIQQAILQLSKDREAQVSMGRAGRTRVAEKFRREDVRDRFLDYIDQAAQGRDTWGGDRADA